MLKLTDHLREPKVGNYLVRIFIGRQHEERNSPVGVLHGTKKLAATDRDDHVLEEPVLVHVYLRVALVELESTTRCLLVVILVLELGVDVDVEVHIVGIFPSLDGGGYRLLVIDALVRFPAQMVSRDHLPLGDEVRLFQCACAGSPPDVRRSHKFHHRLVHCNRAHRVLCDHISELIGV